MQMDMDDPAVTAWLAAARAVQFASCLLIGGVWAFDRLVAVTASSRWRRLAAWLLVTATPLALLSGAAWLVLVAAEMTGTSITKAMGRDVLGPVWSQTRFGRAWQVHAAVWLAGAITAVVWAVTRRGRWVGLGLSIALVGGLAWSGHGNTGPAPAWHRAADVMHLLASAVWPAGLVPFALMLRSEARSAEPGRHAEIARLTRRFSAASLTAVALLTGTGLFDSYCLLGSVGALFTTPYGRTLLVKLVLFTAMVGLGAVNLLLLKPRLADDDGTLAGRLRLSVTAEVVLGVGVVAVVGLLGLLEPGRR
jgi:putative copper resistance protein D